jgi:hypothetical protein
MFFFSFVPSCSEAGFDVDVSGVLRLRQSEVDVPVVKDLFTRPFDESWYPPAHLGGTSVRPAWP